MKPKKLIVAGTLCLTALTAYPWGQKGHDTTAFIAENHLTPITKALVEELLDGKSIVYYANWLDNASNTPEYAYSKTWHYKNVDAGVKYEEAKLHENGDIVRALYAQTKVLQDPNASREQKQLALKMVVHLMGDIHQPMHVGHATDLGGNRWDVRYFGKDTNLHSTWDSSIVESAHKWGYTEWQQQIDRLSDDVEKAVIAGGTPDAWCKETYDICTSVYTLTPQGSRISYDYVAAWTPTIEAQFLKGGLRLADVLNSIYDPSYTPQNSFIKKSK